MSSGTRYDPSSTRKLLGGIASRLSVGGARPEDIAQAMQRISRMGMTPRQLMLNRLWAWYRTEQYTARKVDWNGKEIADPIDHEVIAHAGFIPPGFYDAGENYPIKFRKPTAPYALVKVIVDRFSGLLFSERHHPQIEVVGDEKTEDFINAIVEMGRLWSMMIQARTYGGSMGTVAMGFQFVDGAVEFEVHDPRWCKPEFYDRSRLKLKSFEKRYMYPEDLLDEATGEYVTVWFWYRRIIDDTGDILFEPVEVGDGTEPEWIPAKVVSHNFGFCPIVWIQNLPMQDDIDGDPDCLGIYDFVESIDALLAQANKGVIANSDPTVVLATDAELSEVQKGSNNAIKLPIGGSASYLEITGSGPKSAMEQAEQFRKLALEVAQVVLEHPDVANRTATEIERTYSSMLAKADVMREQYGENGIKPLLEMVVAAVIQFTRGTADKDGVLVRGEVRLPPKVIVNAAGDREEIARELGAGGVVHVKWPRYFEPSLTDVELATRAAIAAKVGGLIDLKHAVEFIREHFRIEDVQAMIANIKIERSEEEDRLAAEALNLLQGPGVGGAPTGGMPGAERGGER